VLPSITAYDSAYKAPQNGAGTAKDKTPTYEIASKSAMDYAWDFPAAPEKYLRLSINGFSRTVQITEIGSLIPFKFLVSLLRDSSLEHD
jgi:vacuolar protein sorting-associated protein 13A/C